MRPAGMSSDEEYEGDEDCYYSSKKSEKVENTGPSGVETLQKGLSGILGVENLDKKEAFHKAAEQGDIEAMTIMCELGVDVDESGEDEWTPLMKACSKGNYEAVEFLLNHGANPSIQKGGSTPAMACCVCSYILEEHKLLCLKKLIEHEADVNVQDNTGTTALMTACSNGLDSVVEELLKAPEINLNLQDKDGWNALFFAVSNNFKSIARRLVDAGINLKALNMKKVTAIELASSRGYREIVNILTVKDDEVPVQRELSEPIVEFLNEMPDENGEGGFHDDVRSIFKGLGMEKFYEKSGMNVSMQNFLLMGDQLDDLGITLGPMKWKILSQGIHRYHVYPWKKSSLHTFERDGVFSFENAINCLANVAKHLTMMCATLRYVQMRIPKRVKGNNSIDKEVITSLVNAYLEICSIERKLNEIKKLTDKIKPIGEYEPDIVDPKMKRKSYKLPLCLSLMACSIAAAAAACIYKLR